MSKSDPHGLDNCGQVIRSERETYGISAAELARLLGWRRERLSRIENNVNPVTRGVIHKIAKVLEIPPERLYLSCLKSQYPVLNSGEVGKLLTQAIDQI